MQNETEQKYNSADNQPAAIANGQIQKGSTPLQDLTDRYLRSLQVPASHLRRVASCLFWLIEWCGRIEIGNIKPDMIFNALTTRKREDRVYDYVLKHIRGFFDWAKEQGYLPADRPTAADWVFFVRMLASLHLSASDLRKLCATASHDIPRISRALSTLTGLKLRDVEGFLRYLQLESRLDFQTPEQN
jgi:hypothetical protein